MNIPQFCISRPALTIVISMIMVIVGVIGFMHLPVRWIPDVTPPVIFISTEYPGANAKVVEHDVTKVIEDSLASINGIESITSYSFQDNSQINVTFKLGQNLETALAEVRADIERIRSTLPKDAVNSRVAKINFSGRPILYISFFAQRYNQRQLSDYIEKNIQPAFEIIDGMGNVQLHGKRSSVMRISLDPLKMAAAKITTADVVQALENENISLPSGQIKSQDRTYSIITNTTLNTAEEFNNIVLRADQQQLLRIKDIGHAALEAEDDELVFRVNGKPAVALGIIPQSNANPLTVEAETQRVLRELKPSLPQGMQTNIIWNQTDYIRASIHSVYA